MVSSTPPRILARRLTDPPARIVALVGEHDLSTVPDVDLQLTLAVASGDPVIVDLHVATFADSVILGAILKANAQAGRRGLAVVMPPPGEVARLFDLVDARSILATFPTMGVAIDWCHLVSRRASEEGTSSGA